MSVNATPKRVFLDTQVFVTEQFNFDGKRLSEIRRLASGGEIKVVVPNVTVLECKIRIEKMIRSARNRLRDNDMRSAVGILQQTSLNCALLGKLNPEELASEIKAKFDEYLSVSKVEIVTAKDISAEAVLEAYFAGKPPFGSEQKKDQFPDAVAVLALEKWQKGDGQQLHVVSGDKDFVSACEGNQQLTVHRTIADFLDSHNKEELRASFVHDRFRASKGKIEEVIRKEFPRLGFILLEEDGDVEDVRVDDVEFGDVSIVAIHQEEADVEAEVIVGFTADVTYEDPNTGYYDREDDAYYFRETVNKAVEGEVIFTVSVELGLVPAGETEVEVTLNIRDVEVDPHPGEARYW